MNFTAIKISSPISQMFYKIVGVLPPVFSVEIYENGWLCKAASE